MKILITGGQGFVGQLLAIALKNDGHEVYNQRFDITQVKSFQQLPSLSWDAVYHLAGPTDVNACEKKPQWAKEIIVDGTQNVLNHIKTSKLIFASSSFVYGEPTGVGIEIDEGFPLKLETVYSQCKKSAEDLIISKKSSSTILRIFSHTHWTQKGSRFLTRLHQQFLQNSKIEASSDWAQTERDIGAIKDLLALMKSLSLQEAPGVYNVGSGRKRNLMTLAKLMAHEMSKELVVTKVQQPVTSSYCANIQKISSALNWTPQYTSDKSFMGSFLSTKALENLQ